MFKKTLMVILCLLPIVSLAQYRSFIIKGKLDNPASVGKIFFVYNFENKPRLDSVAIEKGFFEFKGHSDDPIKAMLFYHQGNSKFNPTAENNDYLVIYMDEGEIEISIADSIKNASVKGSKINMAFEKYKKITDPVSTFMFITYNREGQRLSKMGDSTGLQKLVKQRKDMIAKAKASWIDFIKQNPGSYVSLEALQQLSSPTLDLALVDPLFKLIAPEIRETKKGKAFNAKIEAAKAVITGKIAPDFSHPDLNGKMYSLSDFKGKYVLLDFWASWCKPCRAEAPYLQSAYQHFKDKNFIVLAISIDKLKDKGKWIKAMGEDNSPGIQLLDSDSDDNKTASKLYNIATIPANFLIDPSGKIIATNLRGDSLEKKLAETIK